MNILKKLRMDLDLSLRKLQEKTGVDQSIISQLENDRRKAQLTTLNKLAKGLDVPVEDLFGLLDTGPSERGKKGGIHTQAKKAGERIATTN